MLRGIGAAKGDFAFMMIPRIPAWYEAMIGCIKLGVVAMPGTTCCSPRISNTASTGRGRAWPSSPPTISRRSRRCATSADAGAGDRDRRAARRLDPLRGRLRGGERPARPQRGRADPQRRDDAGLFTSGTTAFPKLVPRDHSYAIAHTLTARYWHDLREDDLHWTMSDTGWPRPPGASCSASGSSARP